MDKYDFLKLMEEFNQSCDEELEYAEELCNYRNKIDRLLHLADRYGENFIEVNNF